MKKVFLVKTLFVILFTSSVCAEYGLKTGETAYIQKISTLTETNTTSLSNISTILTSATNFTGSRVTVSSGPTSANFVTAVANDSAIKFIEIANPSAYMVFMSSWASPASSTSTTLGFDNRGWYSSKYTGPIFLQTEDGVSPFSVGVNVFR